MAHIPDGILSGPVLLMGAGVAAAGLGVALRGLEDRQIPRMAMLSALFFAVSLLAVPVGPSSVHLMLSGLMGVMLGAGAFVAVLVALVLQLALFGMGGLTSLGVNTTLIALPGVLIGAGLGPILRRLRPGQASVLAGAGAALSVLATGAGVALSLWASASEFGPVASVMLVTYLPLAGVEAMVTAALVGFLMRVEPEALFPRHAAGVSA